MNRYLRKADVAAADRSMLAEVGCFLAAGE
jgi:hypothetical protein